MICLTLSMWLYATILKGLCLPVDIHPVTLGRGQSCGGDIEGECAANLTCVIQKILDNNNNFTMGVCKESWEKDCIPCAHVQCPYSSSRLQCSGGLVTDPCGCCMHCARLRGQSCGGVHWTQGYCDGGLTCSQLTGFLPALPPQTGVCKVLPGFKVDRLADPFCPTKTGCYVRLGTCDCESLQTCHHVFSHPTYEDCYETLRGYEEYFSDAADSESEESEEIEEEDDMDEVCTEWSCEVQQGKCLCAERTCHLEIPPVSEEACQEILAQPNCTNITCPEVPVPVCPEDSMLTEPFTVKESCCSSVASVCTCNFESCTDPIPTCSPGQVRKHSQANGVPGSCCDLYSCSTPEEERDKVRGDRIFQVYDSPVIQTEN